MAFKPAHRAACAAATAVIANGMTKFTKPKVACEVNASSPPPSTKPGFFPWRTGQDQEKIKQHRAVMDQIREQALQERGDLELRCARLGVDIAVLEKRVQLQNEELLDKDVKIKELRQKVTLGKSKEQALLDGSLSRVAQIFWSLKRAAPAAEDIDLKTIAHAIDTHDDFDNAPTLKHEISNGTILVFYRGSQSSAKSWRVQYSAGHLSDDQQKALADALECEVMKQRSLFPMRKLIRDTFAACLSASLPQDEKVWAKDLEGLLANDPAKARVEVAKIKKGIMAAMHKAFRTLEESNVDVARVMLDTWRPLVVVRALSAFHFLESLAVAGENPDYVEKASFNLQDIGDRMLLAYNYVKEQQQLA